MKTGGRRTAAAASVRVRGVLIAAEMALSVVLAVSAGLLIKSLWRLTQVDPGFRPAQILAVRVSPNQSLSQQKGACIALYDELVRRASGLSGISQAAAVNAIPMGGEVPRLPVELEGHRLAPGVDLAPTLWAGAVTPDYFSMMRIPVLRGRGFTASDSEEAEPVIVVSAETARAYWPGEEAIGKHVRVVWDQRWRTVIGVVGDVRQYDLADHSPADVSGTFYMPYAQSVGLDRRLPTAMTLLLRSASNPALIERQIRELVTGLNPNVPVGEVSPMESVVARTVAPSRSLMWLFVSFAAFALLLAAVGAYGVVSYSTAQRTFEIAMRVALGATRGSIFGLVLRQSLRLAVAGLGMGILAALLLTRMLSSFLYGITATDPVPFLAVSGLLLLIALLAGYVPARRAASVDPLTALRVD